MAEGRIVYTPIGEHRCVVTFRHGDNGCGLVALDHPAYWATPGTVLECDCGRTFVAWPRQPGEMFSRWRRERRLTRWFREHSRNGLHVSADGRAPATHPGADLEAGAGEGDDQR